MSTVIAKSQKKKNVGMGQVAYTQSDEPLFSILGSCVGVVVFCPKVKFAVLAHVVLPFVEGRDGPPGKFADTAIPHMIDLAVEHGASRTNLIAKIVGGASMFAHQGPIQIGKANAESSIEQLEKHGVRLMSQEIGGTSGRRITVHANTREVVIETKDQPTITI